jgi:mannose-6-phosphate isomerase-like protein (cupin superfamily)
MDAFRYPRIWTDAEGESHFQDAQADFHLANYAPPAPPFLISATMAASRYLFVSTPPGYFGDLHPTPCRQLLAVLKGAAEVQTSDGETRIIHAGDCVLAEDTTGKGHRSRNVGEEGVVALFVQLPD